MTVPGVCAVVSLTYRAGVDDPAWFAKSKSVGVFFGLTPKRYQSGETDVTGAITRVGDAGVRTALHDAANALLARVIGIHFRSTGHILAAANAVISQDKKRLGKTLRTTKALGEPIEVVGFHNPESEQSTGRSLGIAPGHCSGTCLTIGDGTSWELSRVGPAPNLGLLGVMWRLPRPDPCHRRTPSRLSKSGAASRRLIKRTLKAMNVRPQPGGA
jgi:hypothetical protein